ncbi:MAG TPA: preprotein translocase subunit SecE [Spirochaetota bacterium]|nr:preprotein translocase subunit SecE [Spirochaetota bacterium]HOT20375.1 preprotein translocase subunit SecE [Spirochaetota bacterium]HPD06049.1 preprotein translocase subunit SecE [Spirochaetota bacterium]HQG41687.1 preprotein translocase subunit SecE [Spirochaetota bacterium]HQI37296.1 preprotein translocase subunit SecE [Spirochaetota bacterium]
MFNKTIQFVKESRDELKKVSWPERDEVSALTMVVLITVIITSLFLWLVDATLMKIVSLVMK